MVCIPTPGHTVGHQSPEVRTDDREVVLTGDACYFGETLETGRLPIFANDFEVQRQSPELLLTMAAAGAHLVFGHDPTQIPDDTVVTL